MIKAASLKDTKVFSPIKVGGTRAALNEEPSDLQLKHYNDRTQFPGSLVIAEGTVLSPKTGGVWGAPGIYNHSQVQGWKKITQTIHDNNSFVSLQLWACGRVTDPKFAQYHQLPVVAPSVVYTGKEHQQSFEELGIELKSLSTSEIEALIKNEYTQGAKNAMAAGFDYIEIHAAHGYLIESFFLPPIKELINTVARLKIELDSYLKWLTN